jgi:hypothetical protein
MGEGGVGLSSFEEEREKKLAGRFTQGGSCLATLGYSVLLRWSVGRGTAGFSASGAASL